MWCVQIFMEWGENSCFSCFREIPSFEGGAFIKLYSPPTQHIATAPVIAKLFHPDKNKLLSNIAPSCRLLNFIWYFYSVPVINFKLSKTNQLGLYESLNLNQPWVIFHVVLIWLAESIAFRSIASKSYIGQGLRSTIHFYFTASSKIWRLVGCLESR